MDRRAIFFLAAAAMCAVLWPLAPNDKRWVNVWLAVTYVVLALASFADFVSRHAPSEDRDSPANGSGSSG